MMATDLTSGAVVWKRYFEPRRLEALAFASGRLAAAGTVEGMIDIPTHAVLLGINSDTGVLEWTWKAPAGTEGELKSIVATPQGWIAAGVKVYSDERTRPWKPWIMAFDIGGKLLWEHLVDLGQQNVRADHVVCHPSGRCLLVGVVLSYPDIGDRHRFAMKFNWDGTGFDTWEDLGSGELNAVTTRPDGGSLVSGQIDWTAPPPQAVIQALRADGTPEWEVRPFPPRRSNPTPD